MEESARASVARRSSRSSGSGRARDDALRAVRAAHELRDGIGVLNDGLLPEHGVFLEVRTAVTTGESSSHLRRHELATGRPVATAEELERAAKPGQILFDDATHRLVKRVVSGEPMLVAGMDAYRLVEVLPDVHGRLLRLDSPLVGRRRQLALSNASRAQLQIVRSTSSACWGRPASGSRVSSASSSTESRMSPRCSRAAVCLREAITHWPLYEALRDAGLDEGELGDASATSVQSLFERLAVQRPLVVVLDDLHWAEAALLDGMEHVAESSRGAAILIIAVARPELLETRPGWGGGKPNASSALLESLSEIECDRLVDNLLGESDLPDSVRAYVIRTSDGNPLFVEELLATLVDRDLLTPRAAGRRPVPAIPLPSTIQALIAARIDRLPERERVVLELASIDGTKVFHRDMVVELAAEDVRVDVDPCLAALVRKELVRPQPADEGRFSFRHQLIRDAAYSSMPMRVRAELHERLADFLEQGSLAVSRSASTSPTTVTGLGAIERSSVRSTRTSTCEVRLSVP